MKVFIRNFRKQKSIGILGILSLSLGTMVAILIGLWTIEEYSYDNFHRHGDRIYRVVSSGIFNNQAIKLGGQFRPLAEEAATRYPEIERTLRVYELTSKEIKVDNRRYDDVKICLTDSNFFTFFTFSLKEGSPETVLQAPYHAVIDETTAQRLFPDQQALGQIIQVEGKEFTIAGVMHNIPHNSHFKTNVIVPFFDWYKDVSWGQNNEHLTYFLLPPNANLPQLEQRVNDLILEKMPVFQDFHLKTELEPLEAIHFSEGNYAYEPAEKGNKRLVFTFGLVALVILILSCINFTNLFVSVSFLRAKEVGIRKSQGARSSELSYAFYMETGLYVLVAIAIGLLLTILVTPFFNQYVDTRLYLDFTSPRLYVFLLVLFLVTTFTAGSLPAFQISRLSLLGTLKGTFRAKQLSLQQKSLMVLQFTASIVLLLVSLSINRQVDFMLSRDLGFDRENVLYVWSRGNFGKNFETLRNELLKEPSIAELTMSNTLPTQISDANSLKKPGDNQALFSQISRVKESYFDVMGMHFVAGDNPFILAGSDSLNYGVLNETAARQLGFKDVSEAVDYVIMQGEDPTIIKGVIRDAQVRSFHQPLEPLLYMKFNGSWGPVLFKVKGDPQKAIAAIGEQWSRNVSDAPFEYHFLDQEYEKLYTSETNLRSILSFAMLISFLISVAGLFAMAFYATQRRIKEVAVRKVNGATIGSLLMLLNKDFVVWMGIALGLAYPLAYLFMKKYWLKSFVVQAPLSVMLFATVGLLALFIALLTVSWQTYKAASVNPVSVIKNE